MPTGTPKTWASADALTAALLNAELRDQYLALYGPPRGRLNNTSAGANPTLGTAANIHTTFVAGNIVAFSGFQGSTYTGSMTTGGSFWDRLIAPIAGTYEVSGAAVFDDYASGSNVGGTRGALLVQNGATIIDANVSPSVSTGLLAGPTGGNPSTCLPVNTELKLAAADYVQLAMTAFCPSGYVSESILMCYLELLWVGN